MRHRTIADGGEPRRFPVAAEGVQFQGGVLGFDGSPVAAGLQALAFASVSRHSGAVAAAALAVGDGGTAESVAGSGPEGKAPEEEDVFAEGAGAGGVVEGVGGA